MHKKSSEHQINTAGLVNYDFYYFEIPNVNANQSFFKVMMKALGKCIIYLCSHLTEFFVCMSKSLWQFEYISSHTVNNITCL